MTLKLRICVRFAAIFYVERVAVPIMTWSYVRIAVIVYVPSILPQDIRVSSNWHGIYGRGRTKNILL